MEMKMEKLYVLNEIYDNTTNEKRYIEKNMFDEMTYYPLADIYPYYLMADAYPFAKSTVAVKKTHINKQLPHIKITSKKVDIEWFKDRLKEERIFCAIKFLQIKALKKHIVKNFKNKLFKNPFYPLNNSIYPLKYNIDAYTTIVNILLENYDDASDFVYNLCHENDTDMGKTFELKNFIYNLLPIDDNIFCKYCLITEPKPELMNNCKCKSLVHADCMNKWLQNKKIINDKLICEICNGDIQINDKCYKYNNIFASVIDDRYFFPFDDFYYVLSSSCKLVKYCGISRLKMAVNYLQVKRVEELLKEKEILEELPKYYHGHPAYKKTLIIALCDTYFNDNYNMLLGDNKSKYYAILVALLKTKKIDINKKDYFNKTAFDYAIENNLLDYYESAIKEANIL